MASKYFGSLAPVHECNFLLLLVLLLSTVKLSLKDTSSLKYRIYRSFLNEGRGNLSVTRGKEPLHLFVAKYLKLMIELCEFSVDDSHSSVRCGLTNIFTYFSWCS